MLSGSQLVILAMYSTVNVVGPHGSHINPASMPVIMSLLLAAAIMSLLLLYSVSMPQRTAYKPPIKVQRLSRRTRGPAPRRM